ncbi:uncharacterized protein [Typha latifolia]|uniref:uncharacterized protein n=1 Tax=Typha latifolia TaxID=4733 RepID=UPI003C2D9BA7
MRLYTQTYTMYKTCTVLNVPIMYSRISSGLICKERGRKKLEVFFFVALQTERNSRRLHIKEFADLPQLGKKMSAHKIAHATLKGPNVVKEICIGLTLGLLAGGIWKMHHWNEQKKARALYDMLEKGQISVAVPEE